MKLFRLFKKLRGIKTLSLLCEDPLPQDFKEKMETLMKTPRAEQEEDTRLEALEIAGKIWDNGVIYETRAGLTNTGSRKDRFACHVRMPRNSMEMQPGLKQTVAKVTESRECWSLS